MGAILFELFTDNCPPNFKIVREIQKLSGEFRNCPANLEIVRQISKIVRQILKFYFFFQNCPPKKKLSAYSPDNGQFRKLSADNDCPRTIVRQFPKTQINLYSEFKVLFESIYRI